MVLSSKSAKENKKSNLLSTPSIVTMDNERSVYIVVGQNVPFVTGSVATTGNNYGESLHNC